MTGPREPVGSWTSDSSPKTGGKRKLPMWAKQLGDAALRQQVTAALEGRIWRRADTGRTDLDLGHTDDDPLPPGTEEQPAWVMEQVSVTDQLTAIDIVSNRVFGRPSAAPDEDRDPAKERDELSAALVALAEGAARKAP